MTKCFVLVLLLPVHLGRDQNHRQEFEQAGEGLGILGCLRGSGEGFDLLPIRREERVCCEHSVDVLVTPALS